MLGIVYLFNGNTHCQNSLLQQLKEDRSNATLASLRQLILTLGNFIIEIRNLKECEKRKSTFNLKIVDSYDYYDTK